MPFWNCSSIKAPSIGDEDVKVRDGQVGDPKLPHSDCQYRESSQSTVRGLVGHSGGPPLDPPT